MKSHRPLSTRLSGFRFSLSSIRSPVSPLSPRSPNLANTVDQPQSICHSSGKTSPTARGSPSPDGDEKDPDSIAVTVVDGERASFLTPKPFPTPGLSPITPWHASFHRNAASIDQETAYLRRTTYLRYIRIVLSLLLLSTGATLTALEGDILHQYNSTHLPSAFHLSLWPTDLNLKPTLLCLAVGAVATFFALITVVISVIPSPNPRTKLNSASFSLLCGVTVLLSLASIIFASVVSPSAVFSSFVSSTLTHLVSTTGPGGTVGMALNGRGANPKRETIQSFTCAISNTARAFNADATKLQLPSLNSTDGLVPSGFGKICKESHASLAILIVVLGLAAIGVIVAGMSWAVEKQIRHLRDEREALASRDGQNVPESLVGVPYEKGNIEA